MSIRRHRQSGVVALVMFCQSYVTVVGITHMMANVSSFGSRKTKTEKSGTSLKYQVDVKLKSF